MCMNTGTKLLAGFGTTLVDASLSVLAVSNMSGSPPAQPLNCSGIFGALAAQPQPSRSSRGLWGEGWTGLLARGGAVEARNAAAGRGAVVDGVACWEGRVRRMVRWRQEEKADTP